MRAYKQTSDNNEIDIPISFKDRGIELPIILELAQDFKGSRLELNVAEFFDEQETILYSIRPVNAAIKAVEMAQNFGQGQYRLILSERTPESRMVFESLQKLDKIVEIYFRPK